MSDHNDNLPKLGAWFAWVEGAQNQKRIFWAVALCCAALLLVDLFYRLKGYFKIEEVTGFYAIFGFLIFIGLAAGAHVLRKLVHRPEGFYALNATDAEQYPTREDRDV